MPPHRHATPPELVSETIRETVYVEDFTFYIDRPADSDRLLSHPWVRSSYAADQYVPYWPTLWPAARMLAKVVLREPWHTYTQPVRVWKSAVASAWRASLAWRGLHVIFTDVDETALAFAASNARLNGFTANFRTLSLDFRSPPENQQFPVVIGSDLMYEERLVDPLVSLLRAVLAPDGLCLIADPDRLAARVFKWKLEEAGFQVTTSFVRAGEPGSERTKGTLYRIRRTQTKEP